MNLRNMWYILETFMNIWFSYNITVKKKPEHFAAHVDNVVRGV